MQLTRRMVENQAVASWIISRQETLRKQLEEARAETMRMQMLKECGGYIYSGQGTCCEVQILKECAWVHSLRSQDVCGYIH